MHRLAGSVRVMSAGCCVWVLGEMFLSLPYASVLRGLGRPVQPMVVHTESSHLHPVCSSEMLGSSYEG